MPLLSKRSGSCETFGKVAPTYGRVAAVENAPDGGWGGSSTSGRSGPSGWPGRRPLTPRVRRMPTDGRRPTLDRYRVTPGERAGLASRDPDEHDGWGDKAQATAELDRLRA